MTAHTATHHNGRHHKSSSNGKTHRRHTPRPSHEMNGRLAALQDSASTAMDGVTTQLADLKEKGVRTSRAMDQAIVGSPKTSVLFAFGVGYVLARLRKWI